MDPSYKPRPYQVDDLATLINRPQTLLGHEPACGKTYIAGMFSQYIWDATKERIVWTMPGGIMEKNWRDILHCTNFAPEEVVMVQGSKDQRVKTMRDPAAKIFLMTGVGYSKEWELLPPNTRHSFHDEIHLYYVTHNATRTQNFYRAQKNKKAIVPMTGTIIKGRLDSAYPVLHVMAPWAYGNDRQFVQHHAWFDEEGKIIGWKNHERLRAVLQEFGIFRSFKEVYGQESKVIVVERCTIKPKTYAAYLKLEAEGLIELEDSFVDAGNPAVNAMRARQILAAPEQFQIDEIPGKDDALLVDIEDHLKSGERLAIYSVFTKEQERIANKIASLGGTLGHINGTVPYEKRQQIDKDFNDGKIQFVVASPPTAGIGFNWGFLNTVIFVSVDYTDDSFIQAYRRGIRGVREQPLLIKVLKYEDTIENRIFEIVDRKCTDHNLINNAIEPLGLSLL